MNNLKHKSLIILAIATFLVSLKPSFVFSGQDDNQGHCSQNIFAKIEAPGPYDFSAPEGYFVSSLFVKAGSEQSGGGCFEYTSDGSSCYLISGLGTQNVHVEKIGSGPDCKDISHVDFLVSQVNPSPSPSSTPSPSPSETPGPSESPSPSPSCSPSNEPSPSPSPSPTATPSPSPETGVGGAGGTSNNDQTNNSTNNENSTPDKQGAVAGVTTLASTGNFTVLFIKVLRILSLGLIITSLSAYAQTIFRKKII